MDRGVIANNFSAEFIAHLRLIHSSIDELAQIRLRQREVNNIMTRA
jgi:hypothetical protein